MNEKENSGAGSLTKDPAYNKLLPISLLAGLIGLVLGPIPAVAGALIFGRSLYPLFIAAPLLMHFFNKILKGGRDIRAVVIFSVFSLVCAYLTALLCLSASYSVVNSLNWSVFKILREALLLFGGFTYIPISLSASAYAYPLVFTALGVVLSALLMHSKQTPPCDLCEIPEDEAEDDENGETPDDQDAEGDNDDTLDNQDTEGDEDDTPND